MPVEDVVRLAQTLHAQLVAHPPGDRGGGGARKGGVRKGGKRKTDVEEPAEEDEEQVGYRLV